MMNIRGYSRAMSTIKTLNNVEHDKMSKAHKKIAVIGTLFFSFEDFEKV
ncbi:hypothetical protein ES705_38959 [subsurface metagenome]